MAITANGLSALVESDLLALFPTAATSVRLNVATGVPTHNPSFAFIEALCSGTVAALKTLQIMDLGSGTSDLPGAAIPVPFTFAGLPAAEAYLITRLAWTGPQSASAAKIFVTSVLKNTSLLGQLVMKTNPLMGTGVGVVSPAANPALEAAATAALQTALPAAFTATGKFGEGDVPGAQVNAILLAQLPGYAEALAKGIATITAQVAYVGNTSTVAPVTGVVNSGVLV